MDGPRRENAVPDDPRNGAQDSQHAAGTGFAKSVPAGIIIPFPADTARGRSLAISFFDSVPGDKGRWIPGTQPTLDLAPLEGLAPLIRNAVATSKDRLPLFVLGTIFGTRSAANLEAVEGIVGDYDAGELPLDWALTRIIDSRLRALLYSTPSHRPGKPKWRVVLPFSRPLGPDDQKRLGKRLTRVFGDIFDRSSFDLSRPFYFGRVNGQPVPEVYFTQGDCIDLRDDLDDGAAKPQPETEGVDDDDIHPRRADIDEDQIRLLLSYIPADDRDTWYQVGMHLRDLLGDDGFDIWDEWSRTSANYGGLAKVWRSIKGGGNPGRAFGALRKMARAGGWTGRFPDPDIARLNARHAVVSVAGKTLIATERDDGGVDFSREGDLHALYANDRVPRVKPKDSTEPVSARWMRDTERRTYAGGVEFAPGGAPPGVLNLWRGWAVEPNPIASCSRFLEHVREIVCGGIQDHANYVLGWLAHMVQRPQEKPEVALVLRGPKGAGKDTVGEYVARMIGERHAPTVAQSEHIVGRFNARLESALLLHVQEGSWAGDHKAEEVLKYLVSSPRVEIERKGIDSINLRSVLRLFISANAEWVVPASRDERRWAVFEVSDTRAGDDRYFRALRAEMKGDGPAALLHYLRSYDLSGFNVHKAPQTEGLRNQKLASLRGLHRWWFEALHSGEIGSTYATDLDGDWEAETLTFGREDLRSAYVSYMRGRRYDGDTLDSREFGRVLREMLPSLVDRRPRTSGGRIRQYVLPPLPSARNEFAAWLRAPVDWEAEQ